jgi:hypothetical protein
MALKPSYEEMRDFKKFLEGKGFKANDRIDPDAFYLYLSYGYIFLRIEYTKKNEFKSINAHLSLDWNDDPYGKPKFPRCLDFGKPVKSLDTGFIETCIKAANDVMEEISATIQKVQTIVELAVMPSARKSRT